MVLTTQNAQAFQLGQFKFRLHSNDVKLLNLVADMFEPVSEAAPDIECIDLDQLHLSEYANLDLTELQSNLIDHVLDLSYIRHQNCVYMDAAVLLSPQNSLHILAGRSHSGKTTSSLSLCLSKGWKLLSEDISYVLFPSGRFCPIVGPLSIREPTWQLIESQLSIQARALVADRWLKCPELFCKENTSLDQVQSIFILSPISPNSQSEIEDQSITPEQCLRYLLPLSNLVRMPDSIPQFADLIKDCKCFLITGGTLKERVETIVAKATTNFTAREKHSI